ncbi:MAG: hypothetical protein AABW58_00550 [Nanoarchaeota archaeon]
MGERKGLIHLLGDYAEISSICLGAGITTGLLHIGGKLDFSKISEYDIKNLSLIGSLYGLAIFGSYVFLKICNIIKDPVIRNFVEGLYFAFNSTLTLTRAERIGDLEEMIKILDETRRFFRNESEVDFGIGVLKIKQGKIEDGIDYFKKYLDDPLVKHKGPGIIEKFVYSKRKRESEEKKRKNPKDIIPYFELISNEIRQPNIKDGLWWWKEVCKLDLEGKVEINILFALFLDYLEKNREKLSGKSIYFPHRESEDQWRKTVKLILERDFKFESIGIDSRNEVLEIGPSQFLRNAFVFKRGDKKEELKRGFDVNLGLYKLGEKVLGKEELKLVRSLYFADDINGKTYDVTQRKPWRNLEDVFDEVDSDYEKSRLLVTALRNERRIHEISRVGLRNSGFEFDGVKADLRPYDYGETLNRRLIERFGRNQRGVDLTEAIIKETAPYSGRFTSLINGDLAISNLLEDGTVIDFEKASIGNPVIDAITTLEDPKNGSTGKRWLFNQYYLENVEGEEKEFLEESYKPHAAFISMCQTGSKFAQAEKKRKEGKTEQAEKDMERSRGFARQVVERGSSEVKDKFVKYLRSSDRAKELCSVI